MLGASPRLRLSGPVDGHRLSLALGDHQAVAVGVADRDLALGARASVADRADLQTLREEVVAQAVEVPAYR
jgi:hypothetical protein